MHLLVSVPLGFEEVRVESVKAQVWLSLRIDASLSLQKVLGWKKSVTTFVSGLASEDVLILESEGRDLWVLATGRGDGAPKVRAEESEESFDEL